MKALTKEINIINEGTIQFPILQNGPGWKSTEQDGLSVIESGESKVLFKKILKLIDSAERLICLQSFLTQDTLIFDALILAIEKRKVKVFILSSAEARLKDKIEEEQDFIKANYIQLLENKFKNHFIHRSAENFHGKYILIDPTTQPKGFICTNNFTENGFSKNPELAVELNQGQCEELFKIFVYHFWEHSTDEQNETAEFAKVRPANKFKLPILKNILLTSPNIKSNSLNDELIKAINKAKQTISFSTFQLDKATDLIKTIIEKAKQNILVTLFCRPNERQFNEQLKELLDAGVQIYFHPLIHAKSLLVDSKEGFVYTANLMSNGLANGLEVGVKLNEVQTKDLSIIHKNWQSLFPTKAIKVANVRDLSEIEVFKEGKLTKKLLIDDKKDEKRKAIKVADLFSLFYQKFDIKDNSTKTLKVKLTAEIEAFPAKINIKSSGNFEVVEMELRKGKKDKVVVIKNGFETKEIDKLQAWKEMKIYYINQ